MTIKIEVRKQNGNSGIHSTLLESMRFADDRPMAANCESAWLGGRTDLAIEIARSQETARPKAWEAVRSLTAKYPGLLRDSSHGYLVDASGDWLDIGLGLLSERHGVRGEIYVVASLASNA